MEDVRKSDPTFTGFVPRTAAEAVDRYVRCRKNGLKPMLVPECLIECAKGLDAKQLDMFENWIINPNGSLDEMDIVPCDQISRANEAEYIENCKRNNYEWGSTLPPVPFGVDVVMKGLPDSTSS